MKELLQQVTNIQHALDCASNGVHDSTLWYEKWTKPYANGHDSYGHWIDYEFDRLREMIQGKGGESGD